MVVLATNFLFQGTLNLWEKGTIKGWCGCKIKTPSPKKLSPGNKNSPPARKGGL